MNTCTRVPRLLPPPFRISKLVLFDTVPVEIELFLFKFSPVSAHLARSVSPLNTFFELRHMLARVLIVLHACTRIHYSLLFILYRTLFCVPHQTTIAQRVNYCPFTQVFFSLKLPSFSGLILVSEFIFQVA